MSTIRIKPKLVKSSNGFEFDFLNLPISNSQARIAVENVMSRNAVHDYLFVFQMQKFNKKTTVTPQLTPSGNLSKKPPIIKVVPTHWAYKVFAIPRAVVDMLKADGKKIVQHKHHWEIV